MRADKLQAGQRRQAGLADWLQERFRKMLGKRNPLNAEQQEIASPLPAPRPCLNKATGETVLVGNHWNSKDKAPQGN